MVAGTSTLGLAAAQAQTASRRTEVPAQPAPASIRQPAAGLRKGTFAYMLSHEQFPAPELVQLGALASRSGFQALAISDHIQPWQAHPGSCRPSLGDPGCAGRPSRP